MIIPAKYDTLSPAEIAKAMGVCVESVLQERRRRAGKCRYCMTPALAGLTLCDYHRTQRASADRTRKGVKPWQPGGRGRPPKKVN